ncbi:MAG TPA: hypothetical protein VFA04_11205 [Bryobacteraceae bacterium]|nr:hypothetical protein [Bryobacteraceae bacterium]
MRALLLCGALSIAALNVAAEMPPCDKSHLGQFWPEEADNHPAIAVQFARTGELQVCSHKGWHYQWMQPSVTVEQLRQKQKKPATQGDADRQKHFTDRLRLQPPPEAHDQQESSPSGQ